MSVKEKRTCNCRRRGNNDTNICTFTDARLAEREREDARESSHAIFVLN